MEKCLFYIAGDRYKPILQAIKIKISNGILKATSEEVLSDYTWAYRGRSTLFKNAFSMFLMEVDDI